MDNESILYSCPSCKQVWGVYFFPNGTEWERHPALSSYGLLKRRCPHCKGYKTKYLQRTKKQIIEGDI